MCLSGGRLNHLAVKLPICVTSHFNNFCQTASQFRDCPNDKCPWGFSFTLSCPDFTMTIPSRLIRTRWVDHGGVREDGLGDERDVHRDDDHGVGSFRGPSFKVCRRKILKDSATCR